jgi:hypothetical protein
LANARLDEIRREFSNFKEWLRTDEESKKQSNTIGVFNIHVDSHQQFYEYSTNRSQKVIEIDRYSNLRLQK